MRRKRHKQTRRGMRFYRINFGFREPYKVSAERAECEGAESGGPRRRARRRRRPDKEAPSRRHPTPTHPPSHSHHSQVLLDGNFVHALRETK